MRSLTTSDLLTVWERGFSLHPLDRALLVLGAALPGVSYETLADWPLGKCVTTLAAVRCRSFGARLQGWAACRQCGEQLEFHLDGAMFIQTPEEADRAVTSVHLDHASFRLPTPRDLAQIVHADDAALAAARLLDLCRLDAGPPLSHRDIDEICRSMAAADPMAEILLDMPCPACQHQGSASLDLISFFWTELETRVQRLLLDVHHLASRYGWAESDILALSDHRRAFYLDLVDA